MPEYLFSYIKSPAVQNSIEDMHTGTTNQVELNKAAINAVKLPLAPLIEQGRIVSKLDSLFARTKTAREDLYRIPGLIEQYKANLLTKLFSGDNDKKMKLEELVPQTAPIRYGIVQPGEIKDKGIQLIRVCDMMNNIIAWEDLRRVAPEIDKNYSKARVQNDDVLVSVVGTIGRVAIVRGLNEATNIARAVARIRPDKEHVRPEWLLWRLQAEDMQARFQGDAREVARKTLNIGLIKEAEIFVPSVSEQDKMLLQIERAFSKIAVVSKEVRSALKILNRLDEATLFKAFEGKLVPQDPNDETASVLLQRFRL